MRRHALAFILLAAACAAPILPAAASGPDNERIMRLLDDSHPTCRTFTTLQEKRACVYAIELEIQQEARKDIQLLLDTIRQSREDIQRLGEVIRRM